MLQLERIAGQGFNLVATWKQPRQCASVARVCATPHWTVRSTALWEFGSGSRIRRRDFRAPPPLQYVPVQKEPVWQPVAGPANAAAEGLEQQHAVSSKRMDTYIYASFLQSLACLLPELSPRSEECRAWVAKGEGREHAVELEVEFC